MKIRGVCYFLHVSDSALYLKINRSKHCIFLRLKLPVPTSSSCFLNFYDSFLFEANTAGTESSTFTTETRASGFHAAASNRKTVDVWY